MSDEVRRVLALVAQGKITVEEGEQLLAALRARPAGTPADGPPRDPPPRRYMRIAVHRTSERGHDKDIDIRVPLSVARSGVRLAGLIPGLAGRHVAQRLRDQGIDLDLAKLHWGELETMLNELGEVNIDVDHGRSQVRITCE